MDLVILVAAAQQQAEADGSPGEDPECPQLSLSVRRANDHSVRETIDDMPQA